ncbi:PIG-L family deacetylase [Terriglobus sp.]|uniref:PIG-L family deacetylase n=1 Tax=Terriglobus sp. TaxID=1889013 RepID=UPI003B0044E1
MRVAILSPHRDDAAFSCGLIMLALLHAGADLTVVNVFTRSDYAVDLQTVDPALPQVDAVSRARRLEDEHFVEDITASVGRDSGSVQLHDFGWLDAPLRLNIKTERVLEAPLTDAEVEQQAAGLAAQIACLPLFDAVFAPIALGDHIDHRIVRQAAGRCTAADRLCFYEDLPYAARLTSAERKHQAFRAVPSNPTQHFLPHALHLPNGPHLKKRFAMHYPSQIAEGVADEMASYAEQWSSGTGVERWWATRSLGAMVAGLLQSASVPCSLVEEQQ